MPLGRWYLTEDSKKNELAEFYSTVDPIVRRALNWDFSSFTPEEWSKYYPQQDEMEGLRNSLEPILRKTPEKWKEYCKARKRYFNETLRIEDALTRYKGAPGRPRKTGLANEAARLKSAGLSYAKIATRLNQAGGLKRTDKDYATGESIRKLLNRHSASQERTPDKN